MSKVEKDISDILQSHERALAGLKSKTESGDLEAALRNFSDVFSELLDGRDWLIERLRGSVQKTSETLLRSSEGYRLVGHALSGDDVDLREAPSLVFLRCMERVYDLARDIKIVRALIQDLAKQHLSNVDALERAADNTSRVLSECAEQLRCT